MKKRIIQTKMRRVLGIFFYTCTSVNLLAADQQEKSNLAKDLSMLFGYKKAVKNKQIIADSMHVLPTKIEALLKEPYDKKRLKEALGNLAPTATDQHLLTTLQWAYTEGTTNTLEDRMEEVNTAVDKALFAIFSAWRQKNIKNTIQEIQDELADKVKGFMTDTTIDKASFQKTFGYKSNEKDLACLRSLRWAYQCGLGHEPDEVQAEDNEPIPSINKIEQDAGINNTKKPSPKPRTRKYANNKNNTKKKDHTNNPQDHPSTENTFEESSSATPLYIICSGVLIIIIGNTVYQRMNQKTPITRRKTNDQATNTPEESQKL